MPFKSTKQTVSSQKPAALQQREQRAPEHQVSSLASLCHFPRLFVRRLLTKALALGSPEGNVSTGASKIYIKLFHSLTQSSHRLLQ